MAARRYRYTACGLDNVYLLNGYRTQPSPYGKTVAIGKLDELHMAIGSILIRERKTLNGNEVRFLRHELKLSQNRLAALLGVDEQTVARWEKRQAGVSGPADKMIRLLYAEAADGKTEIARTLGQLAELDEGRDRDYCFEEAGAGWRYARAA